MATLKVVVMVGATGDSVVGAHSMSIDSSTRTNIQTPEQVVVVGAASW